MNSSDFVPSELWAFPLGMFQTRLGCFRHPALVAFVHHANSGDDLRGDLAHVEPFRGLEYLGILPSDFGRGFVRASPGSLIGSPTQPFTLIVRLPFRGTLQDVAFFRIRVC